MNEHGSNLRPLMIYGAILASAVLLGVVLSGEFTYQSMGVIALIFGLLLSPLILRHHTVILLVAWNSFTGLHFLPGQPPLWLLCGGLSLGLVLIERSFFREREFVSVPTVTQSLLVFGAIVLATMVMRGGLGVQWLGSGEMAGGRKYLYVLGGIVAYFALSLKRIPAQQASLYIALFWLGGLLAGVGPLSSWLGPPFDQLQYFFHPTEGVAISATGFRVKALAYVGMGIVAWLLSVYGFGGVFHQRHLWRPLLLLSGLGLGLLSGFRTQLVLFAVILGGMFVLEGWHRTRWLWGWLITGMVALAVLIPLTPRLPAPIQRTLSFLPLPVDAAVRFEAQGTMDWRYELYGVLMQDVPTYFWLGKGLAISSRDMEWAETISRFHGKPWDYAYLTGEHHNGFLSVIISFGVWGLLAFLVFIALGLRVLVQNFRYGEPGLRAANAVLLLFYAGWVLLFFTHFGTLYWTFRDFAGALAMGVALNGGMARAPETEESPARELAAGARRTTFGPYSR
jgi:hypothetical protein